MSTSAAPIDYYFTIMSPWAYLGHDKLMAIAGRHGLSVRFKPVPLGEVFPQTGGLPLAKRHPARQRYRLIELQRWREARDLPLNLKPKAFPLDIRLADCVAQALAGQPALCDRYIRAAFAGVWAEDRDLADPADIGAAIALAGADVEATLARARSAEIQDAYDQAGAQAVECDVFGSPTYVLNGENFWGQDRLELLERALDTGRAPYRLPR